MTAQSLVPLNCLCLLLCLQQRSPTRYKPSAGPWTTESAISSQQRVLLECFKLYQWVVMACTVWYEGEENPSFLEDFFSPDHYSTAALAKQQELRVMAQEWDWGRTKSKTKPSSAGFAARDKWKYPSSLLRCCPGERGRHTRDRAQAGEVHSLGRDLQTLCPSHTQACLLSFVRGHPWERRLALRTAMFLLFQGKDLTET